MLGLYIHVPFCSAICNYCNFNRGLFDGALKARYVEAVILEIQRAGLESCATPVPSLKTGATNVSDVAVSDVAQDLSPAISADTVYFGGGTPSLLEPHEIGRIIGACRASFDLPETARSRSRPTPKAWIGRGSRAFGPLVSIVSVSVSNHSGTRNCGASRACTRRIGPGPRWAKPGPRASTTSAST